MFAIDCPDCGGTALVFPSQITEIRNTETGIHVFFTCSCGTRGLWVTGRDATRPGLYWISDAVAA